jgi:thiol-disulfide isomerase/thioredoxin
MTRRGRIVVAIGVLVGLQLLAVLVYVAVQRSREPAVSVAGFSGERLDRSEPAPGFAAAGVDGTPVSVSWPSDRVRIVHFWGTWCEPCREELPSLLAFGRGMRDRGIEVVAIAVDDDWRDIRTFFGGVVPPEVVIATDPTVHKRFGVSTLPDSYLVDRAGRLVERFHGERDWRDPAARDHVLGLME